MTIKFTESALRALDAKPGERFVVWEEDLPGFGVRVGGGAKTFVLKYRLASGRVRWKTLGRVGVITLIKARGFAKDDIGIVARGGDPMAPKDNARSASTVAAVAKDFLEWVEEKRSENTFRNYTRHCDEFIVPTLGTLLIGEVSQADCLKLHHKLRKTPTDANRALATLSSMLTWSMKHGYQEPRYNPCFLFDRNPEKKRKVYLDDAQYGTVGKTFKKSTISRAQRVAMELLILTGTRPIEIASAQWSFVSYLPTGNGRLTLPEHKTDGTIGEKVVPLPKPAVALLRSWPRHAGSPYIFPGQGRGKRKGLHMHPCTLSDAWAKLRKDNPSLKGVRLYDACRHSWASMGISEHDLTLKQVSGQLGHSQPSTTDRYAHLHDKVAREQADLVAGSIAKALHRRRR